LAGAGEWRRARVGDGALEVMRIAVIPRENAHLNRARVCKLALLLNVPFNQRPK